MFVQSARTVEEHGQSPAERLTFRGLEKNGTTIRLAKMNLAVHGLEGDIQQAITYYEDPHELAGKADYVMANPPFNVDEIDADKVRRDPRLPFGLPGVNKKGKVSNGNYVWISYFYRYLNERGRAGFVMSSQASSAGGGEAELRRRLVETGDVDAMIAIRSNFFYLIEICERECDAISNGTWNTRDINRAHKAADEARQSLTHRDESEPVQSWRQPRKVDYFWRHARWLTERFPDAELCDVPGHYRRGPVAVMGRGEVQHLGPPAGRVPDLMANLLTWLAQSSEHPLVASSVFHYEFEFIHPFEDGNGRLGRLWQTLILSRWNPLFADVPVEGLIHARQNEYYEAIRESSARGESTPFIAYMLGTILAALLTPQ